MGMSADTFCCAALTIPPDSSSLISLLFYISDNVMGGDYLLRVNVKLTGSDWIAVNTGPKIIVISRKWEPIMITFDPALIGLTAASLFFSKSKEIKLKFSEFDKAVVTVCIFAAVSIVIIKLHYNLYTGGIYYTSGLRPVYAIARGYL